MSAKKNSILHWSRQEYHLRYRRFDRADHHQPSAYLIAFVAPRTVPYQPVLITSPLWSLSSGTNPLPPHVGHLCSVSVPFSITPSPLHSGHVFCAMWTCVYRKPKSEHSGDEARRGSRVIRSSLSAEQSERLGHPCPVTGAS